MVCIYQPSKAMYHFNISTNELLKGADMVEENTSFGYCKIDKGIFVVGGKGKTING